MSSRSSYSPYSSSRFRSKSFESKLVNLLSGRHVFPLESDSLHEQELREIDSYCAQLQAKSIERNALGCARYESKCYRG